jgi:hypothetical protein
MKDYGSKRSNIHKDFLKKLGFEVVDPSTNHFDKICFQMRKNGKSSKEIMDFFVEEVKKCDALAFATTNKGKVSCGVWKEINTMKDKGGPVIQMPDIKFLDIMSLEETRAYLKK